MQHELDSKKIAEEHLKETIEILENQLKEVRESEVSLRIKVEELNHGFKDKSKDYSKDAMVIFI